MKNAVIGIVFSEDRTQVLCIKRRDVPIWVLPGGGVEEGERGVDAVQREVREECGVEVICKGTACEYYPHSFLAKKLATVTVVLECCPVAGKAIILKPQEESLEVAFFPVDALPEPFFEMHRHFIRDALQGMATTAQPLPGVTVGSVVKMLITHPILVFRHLLARAGVPYNS